MVMWAFECLEIVTFPFSTKRTGRNCGRRKLSRRFVQIPFCNCLFSSLYERTSIWTFGTSLLPRLPFHGCPPATNPQPFQPSAARLQHSPGNWEKKFRATHSSEQNPRPILRNVENLRKPRNAVLDLPRGFFLSFSLLKKGVSYPPQGMMRAQQQRHSDKKRPQFDFMVKCIGCTHALVGLRL